jgi:hypothetical protein
LKYNKKEKGILHWTISEDRIPSRPFLEHIFEILAGLRAIKGA